MTAILLIMVVILILAFILVKCICALPLRIMLISILAVIFITTILLISIKPICHKPFVVNAIEYLIKIDEDGSVTTIKETTYHELKESAE